jgi:hypothetical protein
VFPELPRRFLGPGFHAMVAIFGEKIGDFLEN